MSNEPTARFQRDLGRILLVFFAVGAIDLVVLSLIQGELRFWFPMWIDAEWTRPASGVVYSQSYLAGVACIPILARAVDRAFLEERGHRARWTFWMVCLGALAFIAWWKGGLMIEHGKEREALAWVALTAILWALLRSAEWSLVVLARMSRRELLRRLLFGIAGFFLVMSVLDPLLQVGVQGLEWSTGLMIEVAFFVPAGLALLVTALRLGRSGSFARAERDADAA